MLENSQLETALFAGGCFWCMVSPFHVLEGIVEVKSGYIGGHVDQPTYEQVKTQESGHYEAIQIIYNPEKISYEKLLKAFWMQIDPTDDGGQFHDRGPSYKTGIFYTTPAQKAAAEISKAELNESGRFPNPIVTEIMPAVRFYDAEEYHQDFYKKEPDVYKEDRKISGRDEFILKYWGEDYWAIFEE